jgi:hypothetical protein
MWFEPYAVGPQHRQKAAANRPMIDGPEPEKPHRNLYY